MLNVEITKLKHFYLFHECMYTLLFFVILKVLWNAVQRPQQTLFESPSKLSINQRPNKIHHLLADGNDTIELPRKLPIPEKIKNGIGGARLKKIEEIPGCNWLFLQLRSLYSIKLRGEKNQE